MGIEIPAMASGITPDYSLPESIIKNGPTSARSIPSEIKRAPTEQEIQDALDSLEQGISLFNRRLKFSVNHEINRVVVKVIDRTTDKVIKEIPPEEIQKLAANIKQMIGLLVDEKI